MKKKPFDCVEMKRAGGQRVYESVKNMTLEEESAFWRVQTAETRAALAKRKAAKTTPPTT